jgi:hypothetical protein
MRRKSSGRSTTNASSTTSARTAGHTSTTNDYANNFAKYVLQIGIASERRQINLFVTSS